MDVLEVFTERSHLLSAFRGLSSGAKLAVGWWPLANTCVSS
jgi:hypothetical protein